MNKCVSRAALTAVAAIPLLLLAPATASAAEPAAAPPVHPVVLIGQQHQDPLGAFLTCSPAGLFPVFGPNIILPICIA